jgi:hypothetical protein
MSIVSATVGRAKKPRNDTKKIEGENKAMTSTLIGKLYRSRRATQAAMSLAIVAPMLTLFASPATAAPNMASNFGDPAFEQVWSHTDKPVQDKAVDRSWMWGPEPFYTTYEAYAEGPGKQHLVTYFDKSRMEINNPNGDRNSEWFVTNGLLVVEMISGKIQTGNNTFAQASPANIPVAGDASTSLNAPTYASLSRVASLKGDGRAPNRTGQSIREGLGRTGNVGIVDSLSGFARYGVYEPTLGHNIPDVFWSFLNQKGITYKNGKYLPEDEVIDWLFAMGYPITEPYWIEIKAAGQTRWVLMQAFQRRILTYSPHNPDGWKVEMGNVGRTYYDWRYNQAGTQPTATATAAPAPTSTPTSTPKASIALDPSEGNGTNITVSGRYFPAHAAVAIGVEKASAQYSKGLTTVAAKSDGTFSVEVDLPADANRLGDVVIAASANAGAVRATQTYRFNYDASITVSPREVVVNGSVRVQGQGFAPNASVRIGMYLPDRSMDWRATVKASGDGRFDTTMSVGNRPVGTRFTVVATADGGYKATSQDAVTVIAQPALQVTPNSGPAGVHVNLRGANWPASRAIYIAMRAANSQTEVLLPNPIMSDGNGTFSIPVWVGQEYARAGEVRLIASDAVSKVRLESTYYVAAQQPTATPTAVPSNPTLAVSQHVLSVGQQATVAGSRWPAGATVSLGLGRNAQTGVEEWVASARADGNGSFATSFVVSQRWQNAGQIVLFGTAPTGQVAMVQVWIAPAAGKITPMGLPISVSTYSDRHGVQYVKVNAQGWQRDKAVDILVISADGTVNVRAATTAVKPDGTFSISFNPAAPWWGRTDLGIRATTADGQQFSVRYLPRTEMSKVNGNTYNVTGSNWPANARIVLVLHLDEYGDTTLTSATTDANGAFNFTATLPNGVKIPPDNSNDFEVKGVDEPYSATLDF